MTRSVVEILRKMVLQQAVLIADLHEKEEPLNKLVITDVGELLELVDNKLYQAKKNWEESGCLLIQFYV